MSDGAAVLVGLVVMNSVTVWWSVWRHDRLQREVWALRSEVLG